MKLTDAAAAPPPGTDEVEIRKSTEANCKRIGELQQKLYAEGKQSLLVILQGMDASGKDGAIKKVFSDVNPMGIRVAAFKKPTPDEYAHDFLWRIHAETPPAGMIHVFNRSHYEDIIMPVILGTHPEKVIAKRYNDINNFELMLENNGTRVLKFFLHVTREEQTERLRERMTNPKKFWKHKDEDWEFAKRRDEFLSIYEKLMRQCDAVPWKVVASDKNCYKEWLISKEVMQVLEEMKPEYPPLVTSMKK